MSTIGPAGAVRGGRLVDLCAATPAGCPAADLPGVRLRALPRWEPPALTGPAPTAPARGANVAVVQERLAVDFAPAGADQFDYQPTPADELPAVEPTLRRLVLATLEVMTGLRPPNQVTRAYAPAIAERLAQRHVVARRRGVRPAHPSRVLKVHLCRPTDCVVEAAVVVAHEGRVRAVALRIVGVDGRWLVTALEMA